MILTTVLAPVASGLLTTISLDADIGKVLCILGFLGFATVVGIQTPLVALQAIMKQSDLPMGIVMTGFGATMGNSIWVVDSAAIFQSRLIVEIAKQTHQLIFATRYYRGLRKTQHYW
jgi:hypothetical protein